MPWINNKNPPTGMAVLAGHNNGPHALSTWLVSPVEKAFHQNSADTHVKKIIAGIKKSKYREASTVA